MPQRFDGELIVSAIEQPDVKSIHAMNIFLVRHGQASATWQESDDPGLSELGQQQAEQTAQQLLEWVDPDIRLISSPLLRAQETARPLAKALNTAVTVIEAFREIPTPVERTERQGWLHSIARQSWSGQHVMVRDWHQALLDQLRQIGRPTVVFTHFMVLNAIVSTLSEKDRVVCFLPDNASVTTLRLNGGALKLVELGRELKTAIR